MKSDLNLASITTKIGPIIETLRKRALAIVLFIVAAAFGFLIWRIGMLASAEPSESAVDEKLQSVVRPKINQKSIDAIEELRSENIDIQSYFSDRANPFQE